MNAPRRLVRSIAALGLALSLAACGTAAQPGATATGTTVSAESPATQLWADNTASHAQADDGEYDASSAVNVTLSDSGSTASGAGVSVNGSAITISAPGTYVLSGTLSDGQIVVSSAAEGKVRIVLNNANITNADGPAIVISQADEAILITAAGTANTVTDGATYAGYDSSSTDSPDAAIFSMADLTLAGTGKLTVTSKFGDGIASKDGLVVLSGELAVNAADDGLRGKDYLIVDGGTISVTAAQDGLKATNEDDNTVGYIAVNGGSVTIKAGDDGLHAEGDLAVNGGSVNVASSVEAIEGFSVTLAGGTTSSTSSDDGINVSESTSDETSSATQQGPGGGDMQDTGQYLVITGGEHVVNSSGDGLDSNGSILITGGTTVVNGPESDGNGAIDANGTITVQGGTLAAAGSSGMAEAPSTDSATGWVSVSFGSPVAAGQTISIVSGSDVIASYTTTSTISSLVIATDGITAGQSYDVYTGGTLAADAVASFSAGGDISNATKTTTVTAGEHSGGMGGPGGGMSRGGQAPQAVSGQ